MKLRFLHIVIPQGFEGTKKLESKFQELLVNMRNTFTGRRVSLEYFGIAQYTYFFIVVDADLYETVESLIYATFPEAEIAETDDYTTQFDVRNRAIAGAELTVIAVKSRLVKVVVSSGVRVRRHQPFTSVCSCC